MKRFMYMKINERVKAALGGGGKYMPSTADGNYLAFATAIKQIDPTFLAHPQETAAALGGVLLSDPEAKEEQTGKVIRPLPVATDPRFVMPVDVTAPSEDEETGPDSATEEQTPEVAEEENQTTDEADVDNQPGETDPEMAEESTAEDKEGGER